jgi:hypothetical protein
MVKGKGNYSPVGSLLKLIVMKVAFVVLAFLASANAVCFHEYGGIGEYHKACENHAARKINQLIMLC